MVRFRLAKWQNIYPLEDLIDALPQFGVIIRRYQIKATTPNILDISRISIFFA
jgi:hypothetical protein